MLKWVHRFPFYDYDLNSWLCMYDSLLSLTWTFTLCCRECTIFSSNYLCVLLMHEQMYRVSNIILSFSILTSKKTTSRVFHWVWNIYEIPSLFFKTWTKPIWVLSLYYFLSLSLLIYLMIVGISCYDLITFTTPNKPNIQPSNYLKQ